MPNCFEWARIDLKPIGKGLMVLESVGVTCPLLAASEISLQIYF